MSSRHWSSWHGHPLSYVDRVVIRGSTFKHKMKDWTFNVVTGLADFTNTNLQVFVLSPLQSFSS